MKINKIRKIKKNGESVKIFSTKKILMNFKILFFFILLINFSFEFHREKIESKYIFISKKIKNLFIY